MRPGAARVDGVPISYSALLLAVAAAAAVAAAWSRQARARCRLELIGPRIEPLSCSKRHGSP